MAHKDPIPLVIAQKMSEVVAHACGKCGLVVGSVMEHGSGELSEKVARTHCRPWTCEKCGVEHERRYQSLCDPCFRKNLDQRNAEREAALFEKAKKVSASEHEGPVYWEGGDGDGFFENLGALIDWCEYEEVKPPKYVWPCTVTHPQLNIEDLCEQALEEHHESVELVAEEELAEFLEQWNEKQTGESWEPVHYRVLILEE